MCVYLTCQVHTKFSNLYNIAYEWGKFTNNYILEKWINEYNKTLKFISPILKWYLFLKKIIWQNEQGK